jgi:predicted nucleic acid-binding protein
VRFTVDSNVLVYAVDSATPVKHDLAVHLLIRSADADALLTAQVLGEFVAVIARKYPAGLDAALRQVERWNTIFEVVGTAGPDILAAATFAARYRLQFWDSLIWNVARSAGAAVFLSEDLQDGMTVEGMTVLNPFAPANRARVEALLDVAGAD